MNCHNLNEAQLATYKLQHTPGCTVQDSAAQDGLGHVSFYFSLTDVSTQYDYSSEFLVAWVHQKSIGNCITIFCTVSADKMHQSRDMKVRVVMFIFSPRVLTDDPGDEAEADHGDDPGGQQTLHGGV